MRSRKRGPIGPIGSIGIVALVACSTAVSIPSARAQDASFGCKVLLCAAASAPGWTAIPYCVPIMEEVFRELSLGWSWPTCSQANAASPGVRRFDASLKGYRKMRATFAIALAASAAVSSIPALAAASSAWFPVPETAVYKTGDSWTDRGVTYRLYGVQACIRGTTFTNSHGLKRDCGEASLAMLIALTRDLRPQCYQAATVAETKFVFCIASPKTGAAAGTRIDLGTALVSTGYAFASLRPDGKPVHMPYFVAQLVAQRSHAGLWAFRDVPEPNAIILRALNAQRPNAAKQGGAGVPVGRPN